MKARFKAAVALAGAGWVLSATVVRADFIVTISAPTTSGGYDEYIASAFNNGTNGTGTKLLAVDVTLTTSGNGTVTAFPIDHRDIDNDGQPDANIAGLGLNFGSTAGTFVRVGSYASSATASASVDPSPYETDPTGTGSPTTTVNPAYSNLHSLHIAGISTLPGGIPADIGSGAEFANIVVPSGTLFGFSGAVEGETGDPENFVLTSLPVPEPDTTMLTTVATGLGSFRWRRCRRI